jgi:hypothetical protein
MDHLDPWSATPDEAISRGLDESQSGRLIIAAGECAGARAREGRESRGARLSLP